MTRSARRFVLLTAAAAIPLLTSGCTIVEFAGSGSAPLGASGQSVRICASGHGCAAKGNSGLDATTGLRQLLVGALVPADVTAPATLTGTPPVVVPFTGSPGYAAELQRLSPAPAGSKWVGWTSDAFSYSTDAAAPQALYVHADWGLSPGPDGAPFTAASVKATWVAGWRNVIASAPASRPVACGTSLTSANADVADDGLGAGPGITFCLDSQLDVTSPAWDLGIVTTGARAGGTPGSIVSMPFTLRSANVDPSFPRRQFPVTASTTLPGATLAATPQALPEPEKNGDATAAVAIGIPPGAAPGVYDVTTTVDLSGLFGAGITRSGVGKLTVLPAPPGGGAGGAGGGTKKTVKLTMVLPRGLTIASARANGVPVLLGSTVAGPAVVTLRQGPKKRPRVVIGKRIRLKKPGTVKVTFRSDKLAEGPYWVSVSVTGKVVTTVKGRLVR